MAIASIFASAGVAAMSGSSVASAATMASIAIPEMQKHGYSTRVSAGVVTAAGTLAIMIPPSVGLVLYGIVTENSIGKLLIAGIIPGILSALIYVLGVICWQKLQPGAMPSTTSQYTWAERLGSLKPLWAFIILAFSVLGSIYFGFATPTEAASVGAIGSLIIPLLQKRLRVRDIWPAILRTIEVTTMIFTIIIGAMIFGYFLTVTQATQHMITIIGNMNAPSWMILALFLLIIAAMGCMLDQLAILLITLPLIYPVVSGQSIDSK